MLAKKAEKAGLFNENNLNEITQKTLDNLVVMFIVQFGQNTCVHLKDLIYLFQKMLWITWV